MGLQQGCSGPEGGRKVDDSKRAGESAAALHLLVRKCCAVSANDAASRCCDAHRRRLERLSSVCRVLQPLRVLVQGRADQGASGPGEVVGQQGQLCRSGEPRRAQHQRWSVC